MMISKEKLYLLWNTVHSPGWHSVEHIPPPRSQSYQIKHIQISHLTVLTQRYQPSKHAWFCHYDPGIILRKWRKWRKDTQSRNVKGSEKKKSWSRTDWLLWKPVRQFLCNPVDKPTNNTGHTWNHFNTRHLTHASS